MAQSRTLQPRRDQGFIGNCHARAQGLEGGSDLRRPPLSGAFSAALTSANIALRASGYRTRVQTGHHQKIVESLELTLKSDPKLIQKLKVFSKKRNATSYDAAGNTYEQELEQAISVAEVLQQSICTWLKLNYPELLNSPSQ